MGGTECSKLRLIFDETAKRRGVYLFDEFDAVGGQRTATNDVAEMRRVLNSFLQFMEEGNSTDTPDHLRDEPSIPVGSRAAASLRSGARIRYAYAGADSQAHHNGVCTYEGFAPVMEKGRCGGGRPEPVRDRAGNGRRGQDDNSG